MRIREAVIIDDESMAISALKREIELFTPQIQVIGTATNLKIGKDLIENLKPQIVFLDIKLDDGLGFDLLNQLEFNDFHLIFTTAYSNYAIDAIRVDAFDYLMKPVCGDDIVNSLARLEKSNHKEDSNLSANNLIISEMGSKKIINYNDILRFQSIGNYSKVFSLTNKPILIPVSLKQIEAKCPSLFFRCHKSHLINTGFITNYNSKESWLTLKDDSCIPVSLRKRSALNKLL